MTKVERDDRGKRSDSLRDDLKKASKPTGPRHRSGKEGIKVTQIMGLLGIKHENTNLSIPSEPSQGNEPPEGVSYAVEDPDEPIEVDSDLREVVS